MVTHLIGVLDNRIEVGKSYENNLGNICDILFHDPVSDKFIGRYRGAYAMVQLNARGHPTSWPSGALKEGKVAHMVQEASLKWIVSKAISFATEQHHGQVDRAGMPYILHPIAVMNMLNTKDVELMAIAILHDVIEDCFTYREDDGFTEFKRIGMSYRVIDAVRILTKKPNQSYDDYIESVMTNRDAVRVKICDLQHNMDIRRLKSISSKDLERIEKYKNTYQKLIDIL